MGKLKRRVEDLERKTGGDGPPRVVFCWDKEPCEYSEGDTVIIFTWDDSKGVSDGGKSETAN